MGLWKLREGAEGGSEDKQKISCPSLTGDMFRLSSRVSGWISPRWIELQVTPVEPATLPLYWLLSLPCSTSPLSEISSKENYLDLNSCFVTR